MIVLKLDSGFVKKLLEMGEIKADWSRGLSGKDLTLETDDKDLVLQIHKEGKKKLIEIADIRGSFALWFDVTEEKVEKLKKLLDVMGP